jgi:hypothetical protein
MNKLLILLICLWLFSCSKSRNVSEPFPTPLTSDTDWISYEGILPTQNGRELLVELHLFPSSPGMDSYYKMSQTLFAEDRDNMVAMGGNYQGSYSVLRGSNGITVIQLNDRTLVGSIMRGQVFGPQFQVIEDLNLRSDGSYQLILIDNNFQDLNPRYTLKKRSELFTVEGYLTAYEDTVEYFERNTQKKWAVAQFGYYDEAVMKYHVLANEKHEGIYLKALSYTVRDKDAAGEEIDALVFKRILKMDSIPVIDY